MANRGFATLLGSSPMKPSKRQLELLQYCADGYTVIDAAHIMRLSKYTVMQYATNVKIKLDANTMTQAVAISLRNGYIK